MEDETDIALLEEEKTDFAFESEYFSNSREYALESRAPEEEQAQTETLNEHAEKPVTIEDTIAHALGPKEEVHNLAVTEGREDQFRLSEDGNELINMDTGDSYTALIERYGTDEEKAEHYEMLDFFRAGNVGEVFINTEQPDDADPNVLHGSFMMLNPDGTVSWGLYSRETRHEEEEVSITQEEPGSVEGAYSPLRTEETEDPSPTEKNEDLLAGLFATAEHRESADTEQPLETGSLQKEEIAPGYAETFSVPGVRIEAQETPTETIVNDRGKEILATEAPTEVDTHMQSPIASPEIPLSEKNEVTPAALNAVLEAEPLPVFANEEAQVHEPTLHTQHETIHELEEYMNVSERVADEIEDVPATMIQENFDVPPEGQSIESANDYERATAETMPDEIEEHGSAAIVHETVDTKIEMSVASIESVRAHQDVHEGAARQPEMSSADHEKEYSMNSAPQNVESYTPALFKPEEAPSERAVRSELFVEPTLRSFEEKTQIANVEGSEIHVASEDVHKTEYLRAPKVKGEKIRLPVGFAALRDPDALFRLPKTESLTSRMIESERFFASPLSQRSASFDKKDDETSVSRPRIIATARGVKMFSRIQ